MALERLDVLGFGDPKFDTKMMDKDLVLAEHTKGMIKDLTRMYNRASSTVEDKQRLTRATPSETDGNEKAAGFWSADFVKGKGQGLIFLLHGKPGTGKTYTAGKISWGCHVVQK